MTEPSSLQVVKSEIQRLAALDLIEYASVRRQAAADLGWTAGNLDDAVKRERKAGASPKPVANGHVNGLSPPSWRDALIRGEEGQLLKRYSNAITLLMHHEDMRGRLAAHGVARIPVWEKPAPWDTGVEKYPRSLQDIDITQATVWLEHQGLPMQPEAISKALLAVADKRRVNPIADYLNGLVWDETPRLPSLLSSYFGADVVIESRWVTDAVEIERTLSYLSEIGRMWLISAVARALNPGCKVDTVVVLEGSQGSRKSTALKVLFGSQNVIDTLADIGSRDAAQQLSITWCVELAELDHLNRADQNTVKRWLSVATDTWRSFYGRYQQRVDRPSIFVATHNPSVLGWQRDETGGRRWWPVECGQIDIAGLGAERDQLWAEAVHRYRAGEKWWLSEETDGAVKAAAEAEQASRRTVDAWDEPIRLWLDACVDTSVSLGMILSGALSLPKERWDRPTQTRVGIIMADQGGWERYRHRDGYEREYRYRRRAT